MSVFLVARPSHAFPFLLGWRLITVLLLVQYIHSRVRIPLRPDVPKVSTQQLEVVDSCSHCARFRTSLVRASMRQSPHVIIALVSLFHPLQDMATKLIGALLATRQ